MTDPFAQPYVFPGAERPERPRPLLGNIFGWAGLVLGALVLLTSLVQLSVSGIILGLCAAAAGALYIFGKPSRGRLMWATPAIATIPALIAFGIASPTPATETPAPAAFAAPVIAEVTTSTARATTTTPARPTTTQAPATTTQPQTIVPAPETVTVYAPPPTTTTAYVPAPAPAPAYIAEPEPAYVPPAPVAAAEVPSSVSYANCTAVKAAGAAPIYAGEPGYSTKLDRDGDGVACEK